MFKTTIGWSYNIGICVDIRGINVIYIRQMGIFRFIVLNEGGFLQLISYFIEMNAHFSRLRKEVAIGLKTILTRYFLILK